MCKFEKSDIRSARLRIRFFHYVSLVFMLAYISPSAIAFISDTSKPHGALTSEFLDQPSSVEFAEPLLLAGYQMNDQARQLQRKDQRANMRTREDNGQAVPDADDQYGAGKSRPKARQRDRVKPKISIVTPRANTRQSHRGFKLVFKAKDNQAIARVMVSVESPGVGLKRLRAVRIAADRWRVLVPRRALTPARVARIRITAVDRARNQRHRTLRVRIAKKTVATDPDPDPGADPDPDQTGPAISLTGPTGDEPLPATGFAITGTVKDDSDIIKVTATVSDPVAGATVSTVSLNGDGAFKQLVSSTAVSAGETVQITIKAEDAQNNESIVTRSLQIADNTDGSEFNQAVTHALSRLTFGATPELMAQVAQEGIDRFVDQQLNPTTIDDSAFESFLATLGPPQNNYDVQKQTMLRMVSSRRQLQEVMTQFWDNHFNTVIWASSGDHRNDWRYELKENHSFRTNAFGNFRTLLGLSAMSPSMLIYLDSATNLRDGPNENYIRELLELHTLGVNGGYDADDISAGARIFTGWHIRNGEFWFNASAHEGSAENFLGVAIGAGGKHQGDQVLDIVARHPSTANNICRKLIQLLVSEVVQAGILNNCTTEFRAAVDAEDQIARVLRVIVSSSEFAFAYGLKVKTPLEYVMSAVRNLTAAGNGDDLAGSMWALNMPLFGMAVPTGYSELGEDFLSPDQFVHRMKWLHRMVWRNSNSQNSSVDVLAYFGSRGLTTADAVVDFLEGLAFVNGMSAMERSVATDVLNDGGEFSLQAEDADSKLRRMLGRVFSFPGFQFQ